MNSSQTMDEQEKRVLRWGGLAGMLGGILHILTFVVVLAGPVGGRSAAELEEWAIFPDIIAARIVENGLYLVALILGVMLFLALYWALRRTDLALALFGGALGIMGLVVLAAGAHPHIAVAPLSELYHAAGATPGEQATLALMWLGAWGLFDALLAVGFFVVAIGFIALGVAMLGAPTFGKGFGWLSVLLGVVGLAAAIFNMVDPASMVAALTFLAIIIFQLVLGWKVYRLSKALQ